MRKNRKGQAAVEYVLLILVSVIVFGYLFFLLRRELFQLWVCEIGPRVQSPVPCKNRRECFDRVYEFTTPQGKRQVDAQRRVCQQFQ